MILYVARHGETEYNVAGRIQGQHDIPLNEKGRALAKTVGEALCDVDFDAVFTSPLSRAKETALLLTEPSRRRRGAEIPVYEDLRLMEISFGTWSGHCFKKAGFDLPGATLEEFNLFYSDPYRMKRPPEGETVEEVCERTFSFLTELLHDEALENKTVLVSTHGCALRALLRSVYKTPGDYWHGGVPANCSYTVLSASRGEAVILENDVVRYDPALSVNRFVPET